MRRLIALTLLLSPIASAQRPIVPLDNGLKGLEVQQQAALLKKLGYVGMVTRPDWCNQALVDSFTQQDLKLLATYVVIPAGKEPPAALEKHFEMLKEHQSIVWLSIQKAKGGEATDVDAAMTVRKVVDLAAKQGLKTCLYPHVNFHTDTVASCERIHKLAERPELGLSFTLCHFLAQNPHSKLEATLKRIAPKLMLVQINGANQLEEPKADWKQLIQPLGSGSFDVSRVLKTLDEIAYQGPVALQCYNIKEEPTVHLDSSMEAWKKMTR